ncbi:MAG TPA: glutamine--fructose-6-phosphate transaminase (isomerizing) [Thermoleophilaceae bacterium]|nr:glutamine--fructose-6-phosphate transaminase (isomerizing) [Thermoleophilaceae bacterium]
MCGIIGYVGSRQCRDLLLQGLQRLEYRGYDSAGLSLVTDGAVGSVHAVGNLQRLRDALAAGNGQLRGSTGIGHTRWATHGRVTEENAHPHWDTSGRVHIVLNGIVENWTELRERLRADGAEFTSETDAEVVAHLVSQHLDGDLVEATRRAYNELRGHYAFVAMSADHPGVLVGARKECPLVVGLGEGESFIASAIPAFMAETRRVQLVKDGEIVVITPEGSRFLTPDGAELEREVDEVDWDDEQAEKGGYETFMLKEIHEQADAVAETLAGRVGETGVDLGEIGISDEFLRDVRRIVIVACGTSYHAGLVGRYAIEWWSRVPVEMDIASEFRYRNPVLGDRDLVIGISQSGETADTLAAMRLARERGAKVLAVTNIMGSQATRDADGVIFTRAGLEIGVAATKTFVAQVAAMYLFALELAQVHGTLEADVLRRLCAELRELPRRISELLERVETPIRAIAEHWQDAGFFLYLGRHVGLSVCLEGALKLKEISYIPTDAYAAGEMKHGPIALLDENTPVVCVATDSPVLDKVLSNMAEVHARGAHVIAVATEGSAHVAEYAEEIVEIPRTDWLLQPLLAVIPLQLLAYHIARARGLNVDQPRNLAKTVTVE